MNKETRKLIEDLYKDKNDQLEELTHDLIAEGEIIVDEDGRYTHVSKWADRLLNIPSTDRVVLKMLLDEVEF